MADENTKKPEVEVPAAKPAAAAAAEDVLRDPASEPAPAPEEKTTARKRKGAKFIPTGIAYIHATFNNTMVTLTDLRGNTVSWSSAGKCGFKGSRKSTAYAATVVAQEAARMAAANVGMREVEVCVQGPGAGRESAIRGIQSAGLAVTAIRDVTPIPHNGCRQPKARRV